MQQTLSINRTCIRLTFKYFAHDSGQNQMFHKEVSVRERENMWHLISVLVSQRVSSERIIMVSYKLLELVITLDILGISTNTQLF